MSRLGYGKSVDEVQQEAIGDFFYRLLDYQSRLSIYEAGDNSGIKAKLDDLLAIDASLARQFHEERQR